MAQQNVHQYSRTHTHTSVPPKRPPSHAEPQTSRARRNAPVLPPAPAHQSHLHIPAGAKTICKLTLPRHSSAQSKPQCAVADACGHPACIGPGALMRRADTHQAAAAERVTVSKTLNDVGTIRAQIITFSLCSPAPPHPRLPHTHTTTRNRPGDRRCALFAGAGPALMERINYALAPSGTQSATDAPRRQMPNANTPPTPRTRKVRYWLARGRIHTHAREHIIIVHQKAFACTRFAVAAL